MKYRTGFVSNSSSSSYVIRLNGSGEPCPHCKHKPEDILDAIRGSRCDHETSVEWDDVSEYLMMLNNELKDECNFLAKLEQRDPNEVTWEWGSTRVKDSIKDTESQIKRLRERIANIEQMKAEDARLAGIEISYHDEYIQHVFDECVELGTVTIVEDWS